MTRLAKVPIEQWESKFRAAAQIDDATAIERDGMSVMAHSPSIASALLTFGGSLWQNRTLPRRLLEMVRLRIAFHNQCRSCMAIRYKSAVDDGLTEGLVCSLATPYESPDLTEAEKAAIAYADISSIDHFSIDDQTFDDLRRHYNDAEIVELGVFIAFFLGFGRLSASWDMVEELPHVFQDKSSSIGPWAQEAVIVRG